MLQSSILSFLQTEIIPNEKGEVTYIAKRFNSTIVSILSTEVKKSYKKHFMNPGYATFILQDLKIILNIKTIVTLNIRHELLSYYIFIKYG